MSASLCGSDGREDPEPEVEPPLLDEVRPELAGGVLEAVRDPAVRIMTMNGFFPSSSAWRR
jgi:hypothetical protein